MNFDKATLEAKMLANGHFTEEEFAYQVGELARDFFKNQGYGYVGETPGPLTYTDLMNGLATYIKENCL